MTAAARFRSTARARFLSLSPQTRRSVLRVLGRRAPWDPAFDFTPPQVQPGFVIGPPDFVGVGVQKAGTTWWFSLIEQHPEVYSPPGLHKERHFFARFGIDTFGEQHVLEYHGWFPRPPGRRTGEWTPDYLAWHWVPPLLRRAAPDARLLVLLRDPVERYRSGMSHGQSLEKRRDRANPATVSDAFVRGLYAEQLQRVQRAFPSERVLILQFERCLENPGPELAKTFAFLGMDDGFCPDGLAQAVNATGPRKKPLERGHQDWLVELYTDDVLRLAAAYPQIDLRLWPSFAHLA